MKYIETKIRVRYNEVDRMNVIHNSRYFIYQEEGKFNFLDYYNLNKVICDENDIYSPVTKNYMEYIKPATVRDILTVKVSVYKVSQVEVKYVSGIFNDKNELMAFGFVSNCFSDKSLNPIAIKKIDEETFNKFKSLEVKDELGEINKKNIINFFND